jgi:hypothetical protein
MLSQLQANNWLESFENNNEGFVGGGGGGSHENVSHQNSIQSTRDAPSRLNSRIISE